MPRTTWHLDCDFPAELFNGNWPSSSLESLQKLFQLVESSDAPVLSTLPDGITPAGAAIAAAMYFLPSMRNPPKSHCRIAVYPGVHFINDLRDVKFPLQHLYETLRRARMMNRGGSLHSSRPITRLIERKKLYPDEELQFHWLWKSQRVWTRYNQIEFDEFTPRGYYGRDDDSEATIDILECEKPETVSNEKNVYDLLVYCPNYHSKSYGQNETDTQRVLRILNGFKADRKLVVTRSPFNYWSKVLESALTRTGVGFTTPLTETLTNLATIKFQLVEQFINLDEAVEIFRAIKSAKRSGKYEAAVISEFQFVLRFLLSSIDPKSDAILFEENISRLRQLCSALDFTQESDVGKIVAKIEEMATQRNFTTKLDYLISIDDAETEIWVTKDFDKRVLVDAKTQGHLNFGIQKVQRWVPKAFGQVFKARILPRIDTDNDLDLLPCLKPGDMIVFSAWEAVTRTERLNKAWEISQRWIDCRIKNLNSNLNSNSYDPVLEFTDYLERIVPKPSISSALVTEEDISLDEFELPSHNFSEGNRLQFGSQELGAIVCRELFLEGGYGLFLRKGAEVQVLKAGDEDDEFESLPLSEVQSGDTILVFRDSERNSLFDLLLEQLERTDEFSTHAKNVKMWKDTLRSSYLRSKHNFSDIRREFVNHGKPVDVMTIRSWIMGATMAPLRIEHLLLLIEVLSIPDLNPKEIYSSVKSLRGIARVMGRGLNSIILTKDLDSIDQKVRKAIDSAGIDLEELLSAVEARRVVNISQDVVTVRPEYVGNIFKRV